MCNFNPTLEQQIVERANTYKVFPWYRAIDRKNRIARVSRALLAFQPGTVGGPVNPFPKIPVRMLVKVPAHYRLPPSARTDADRIGTYDVRPNHPRVPAFAV